MEKSLSSMEKSLSSMEKSFFRMVKVFSLMVKSFSSMEKSLSSMVKLISSMVKVFSLMGKSFFGDEKAFCINFISHKHRTHLFFNLFKLSHTKEKNQSPPIILEAIPFLVEYSATTIPNKCKTMNIGNQYNPHLCTDSIKSSYTFK